MKIFKGRRLSFLCVLLLQFNSYWLSAQNCDVDFPATASRTFSAACGVASNLTLGKSIYMGNGDTFTFDAPSTINISGNVTINAEGGGKIVIPAGVTVNVDGNFNLNTRNGGCSQSNPCSFEIVVNGTLHLKQNFQNSVLNLIWSGVGTVTADKHFDNGANGCMTCSTTGCPAFNVGPGECDDKGTNCSGANFCTILSQCSSDTRAPVITGCPANMSVTNDPGLCTKVVTWIEPTATDNCTLISFEPDHPSGSAFTVGSTTKVTYTAKDKQGNIATCTFNVIVSDTEAPVIAACVPDIETNADPGQCSKIVSWNIPAASDNCTPVILTAVPASNSPFAVGSTTVTYTAKDNYGNTSTCSFVVLVKNIDDPIITGCPEDISLEANESGVAYAQWVPPTATAVCGDAEIKSLHKPGDPFAVGTTTVEYIATDVSGNSASCTFKVIVAEPEIKVDVIQVLTPDGDGTNDKWTIVNIENFKDNEVEVVDRWGGLIYKATRYDNDKISWAGTNRGGQLVPTGTYFYTLLINYGSRKVKKTGFIEVIR